MLGRISGTVIALFGVALRYVLKVAGRLLPADAPPTALAKARPAARHRQDVERGVFAETAIIVCVVLIAVALGVASGLWINKGSASSPYEGSPSSAQSPPGAHATEQAVTAPAIRNQPDDPNSPSQVVAEAPPLPDPDESSSTDAKRTRPDEAAGNVSEERRAAKKDDTATPNARDENPPAKTSVTPGRTPGGEARLMGGRGAGRVGPCTLSASASAVTIRSGGGSATITLRLNGATNTARISAATPNWSDVVVFAESQTNGNGVSVRWYTIRSVSRRAGIYRVSFTTPCGSKTIAVTVTP